MKNKKSFLVGAIATIALCVSLVAGATFALFTGKTETNVAVKAGEIKLVATVKDNTLVTSHKEWNGSAYVDKDGFYAGAAALNASTQTLALVNILPMDKVSFTVSVKNDSTIPVKYRTVITGIEDDGLFAGLKLTVNGVEYSGAVATAWTSLEAGAPIADVTVVIELPGDAGDEYQGRSCTLNYKIEAVQGNADTEG